MYLFLCKQNTAYVILSCDCSSDVCSSDLYELLRLLMNRAGIVTSRDMILERVWGTDFEGESRTLDMHIKTLRRKLNGAGAMIKTIRNVGYMFAV